LPDQYTSPPSGFYLTRLFQQKDVATAKILGRAAAKLSAHRDKILDKTLGTLQRHQHVSGFIMAAGVWVFGVGAGVVNWFRKEGQ
jgi:hypothetical protein